MTRTLIIGGHGKVALLAEPLLVAAGHEVSAVIRNPEHVAGVQATGARAIVADVESLDQAGTDALVAGYDDVIWSAGAGGGNPERTKAVDEEAAIRVLRAVESTGARLIMVSYFDASLDHGVPADNPFFAYADAKAHADAAIRNSRARWVILGPSKLTLTSEGGISLGTVSTQVSRATVARVIAEVVSRPDVDTLTLNFNDGQASVSDTLDSL